MAILLGLIVGILLAIPLGLADFSGVLRAGWIEVTTPFHYGLPTFDLASIVSMTLVMLVSMVETTGNVIAVGEIIDKPITPDDLTKALRADGLSTVIGGILNAFPYTAYAQNVGLVSLTGVKSRFVVASAGVILMILGLFPKLAAIVAAIPAPVLGGAGLALFGTVAASGIKTLARVKFDDNRNVLIVALSLAVGLISVYAPSYYHQFPDWVQIILNSGITAGSITAIVLNLFLGAAKSESQVVTPEAMGEVVLVPAAEDAESEVL